MIQLRSQDASGGTGGGTLRQLFNGGGRSAHVCGVKLADLADHVTRPIAC